MFTKFEHRFLVLLVFGLLFCYVGSSLALFFLVFNLLSLTSPWWVIGLIVIYGSVFLIVRYFLIHAQDGVINDMLDEDANDEVPMLMANSTMQTDPAILDAKNQLLTDLSTENYNDEEVLDVPYAGVNVFSFINPKTRNVVLLRTKAFLEFDPVFQAILNYSALVYEVESRWYKAAYCLLARLKGKSNKWFWTLTPLYWALMRYMVNLRNRKKENCLQTFSIQLPVIIDRIKTSSEREIWKRRFLTIVQGITTVEDNLAYVAYQQMERTGFDYTQLPYSEISLLQVCKRRKLKKKVKSQVSVEVPLLVSAPAKEAEEPTHERVPEKRLRPDQIVRMVQGPPLGTKLSDLGSIFKRKWDRITKFRQKDSQYSIA